MNPLKIDAQEVVRVIVHSLRGLFAWLCEIIYPWIANLYDIFKELGTQVYSEDFVKIYNKISLIIGIFMVFRVTFWLIESLINPDSMSDKEKTPYKIIQKVFIAIILLATTPTIFKTAFQVQNKILESEIIEKIISTGETLDQTNTTMGRYLSAELFVNFYSPTIVDINGKKAYSKDKCVSDFTEYTETSEHGLIYKGLLFHGKLNDLTGECLTKKENLDGKKNDYIIDFNGLFAVAVGIFVLWMLLMYCISLGTRYVQLIYLQVIAPIPIMCYLAPSKDNMFSKWIKQCTTTYLDLFIRIAIINFVMLLCTLILSNESNALEGIENTTGWIQLFLVLGLLAFAKKAPELIQELLPKSLTKASGDFGLSLKKRSESMLGGKFMYNSGKKAIGFLGAMPGMLAATGVRAYNAHKYNQRENAKLEDYRAKRVSMFKENKEKAIANWRNKGLTEEQIKENAAKFDKKIDRVSNQSKASLRRELRQGTSNLTKAYEKTKYTNREVAANLIERIDENRDSGMGHRNQGLTTASSLIGGTYRAANAAIHGKSVGEIISKANESHVKKIIQEQSWYNKDGGDTSFKGVIDRSVAQIKQKFGIETDGQAVQYMLDSLEADVKAQEELVSETKAKEQGHKYGKNTVDSMKTKGSSEVGKNKSVKFSDGRGGLVSCTFSTRTGEMESSIGRLEEQYRSIDDQKARQKLSTNNDKKTILENFIENIAKNASSNPDEQLKVKNNLNKILEEPEITVQDAFNKLIVAGQQAVGKAKSDYGKYQNATAIMKRLMDKANEGLDKNSQVNTSVLYSNQDIELSYEGLIREFEQNPDRYDDKTMALVNHMKNFLTEERVLVMDEHGKAKKDENGEPVYKIKKRDKTISVDNITEQYASDLAQLFDELEERLKDKTAEHERMIATQTEELEGRKHLQSAVKSSVITKDKLNADKWSGKN